MDPMTIAALMSLLGAGASGAQSAMHGGSFLGGDPGGFSQHSTMTPEQMQQINQLLGGLQGPTGAGLDYIQGILSDDPGAFADFEAPFKQQFEQETVPMIAERFAGLNAGSSSAMNQTLGQAGSDLSTQLAGLRANLKQGALSQLQGLMGQGLQPTFQTAYQPGTPGFLGSLGSSASQAGGSAFARLFGG